MKTKGQSEFWGSPLAYNGPPESTEVCEKRASIPRKLEASLGS